MISNLRDGDEHDHGDNGDGEGDAMVMVKMITLAKFSEQVFTKHCQPIHVSCIVEHIPDKVILSAFSFQEIHLMIIISFRIKVS